MIIIILSLFIFFCILNNAEINNDKLRNLILGACCIIFFREYANICISIFYYNKNHVQSTIKPNNTRIYASPSMSSLNLDNCDLYHNNIKIKSNEQLTTLKIIQPTYNSI